MDTKQILKFQKYMTLFWYLLTVIVIVFIVPGENGSWDIVSLVRLGMLAVCALLTMLTVLMQWLLKKMES